MGKRTIISCDLCGNTDLGCYLVIKGKRPWYSWYESGFSRVKIYICEDCQKSLVAAATEDRELREKEIHNHV